jgi:hypothetical protein
MSDYKGKLPFVMGVHVYVWTFAVCWMITYFKELSLWVPIFLFVGHWFSDRYKIYLIEKEKLDGADETNPDVLSRLKFLFHVDQAWHILQLLIVAVVL